MTLQFDNNFKTTSNVIGNSWLLTLLIVGTALCLVIFLTLKSTLYLILAVLLSGLMVVSIFARQQKNGRMLIEKFYNLFSKMIHILNYCHLREIDYCS